MGLNYDALPSINVFPQSGEGVGLPQGTGRGTCLCQFKNPLNMPSNLGLIVLRFSS